MVFVFVLSSALNRTQASELVLLSSNKAPGEAQGPVRTEMLPERLHALAEAPSAVAEEVIRALEDGTLLHVLPSAFLLTCTPSTRRLIDGICTRLTA